MIVQVPEKVAQALQDGKAKVFEVVLTDKEYIIATDEKEAQDTPLKSKMTEVVSVKEVKSLKEIDSRLTGFDFAHVSQLVGSLNQNIYDYSLYALASCIFPEENQKRIQILQKLSDIRKSFEDEKTVLKQQLEEIHKKYSKEIEQLKGSVLEG